MSSVTYRLKQTGAALIILTLMSVHAHLWLAPSPSTDANPAECLIQACCTQFASSTAITGSRNSEGSLFGPLTYTNALAMDPNRFLCDRLNHMNRFPRTFSARQTLLLQRQLLI